MVNGIISLISLSELLFLAYRNVRDFCALILFCFVFLFRAAPVTYGCSQARGQIRVAASGLCQSHSNAGSELCLRLTPQLVAMPDPDPLSDARD